MTIPTTLDRLKQELQVWRQNIPTKAEAKDPAGQELYELNLAWAKTKADHDALLNDQRAAYEVERARLLGILQAVKPSTPRVKSGPGRPPRPPYSDAVKRAAYRASLENSRSALRVAMGMTGKKDMNLFDQTIAEGKDLV